MSYPWESIVSIARDVDAAYAKGEEPETAVVARLARAVLDFQRGLSGPQVRTKSAPAPGSTGDEPEPSE